MSASLVGSEMCIRDRRAMCRSRPKRHEAPRARREHLPSRVRSTSVHYYPVSYTHLTLPTICSV
eukprot:799653-Alexandrium_andersonii.AAC.1